MSDQIRSTIDTALSLLKQGVLVIPIEPNSKKPLLFGHSKLTAEDIEPLKRKWKDLKKSAAPHSQPNAAIVGNPSISTIVSLDFDTYKGGAELAAFEALKPVLPKTYTERSARGGYHYFYRVDPNAAPISSMKRNGIEIKGAGTYALIAPSQVDGKEYVQISKMGLEDVSLLPLLPIDVLEPYLKTRKNPSKSKAIAGGSKQAKKALKSEEDTDSNPYELITLEDIHAALEVIPSDDRDVWLKVGMGLKRYGEKTGQKVGGLWLAWSEKSVKFAGIDDCRRVWKSIEDGYRGDGEVVTIASVFDLARQYDSGFEMPSVRRNVEEAVSLLPSYEYVKPEVVINPDEVASVADELKEWEVGDDFYFKCPAPIGGLCKSLCDMATSPLPGITFGTLLGAIGYLKAGRYKLSDECEGSHCTNYVACFAPTSDGKGFAQGIVLEALKNTQNMHSVIDRFKSVAAMGGYLMKAPRHSLLQVMDEYADFFAPSNDKTPSHIKDLHTSLNDVWSKNDLDWRVSGTKKEKFKDDIIVNGPKLNIVSYTQTQNLLKIDLESSVVSSGLLPRFLVFNEVAKVRRRSANKIRPPKKLEDYFSSISLEHFLEFGEGGNEDKPLVDEDLGQMLAEESLDKGVDIIKRIKEIEDVRDGKPEPVQPRPYSEGSVQFDKPKSNYKIVIMSDDALEYYLDFKDKVGAERDKLNSEKQYEHAAMLGKAAEIANRVAVTIVDGRVIEVDLMKWCCELVYKNLKSTYVLLSRRAGEESPRNKHCELILQTMGIFKKEGKDLITVSDLYRKLERQIKRIGGSRVHKECLQELIVFEKIRVEMIKVNNRMVEHYRKL